MRKVLLTGGSGFIGSHFHRLLSDVEFINIDLVEPTFQYSASFIAGDIRNERDLRNALQNQNIDTIISLAAKHHDFGIGHDEYFDTNEDGTKMICKLASEFNIKNIVFYSSVAVYGIQQNISNEGLLPEPDSPYGASKLAGEKALEKWSAENTERKVLIMRPTIVFGPNNMANMYNLIRQIDSGLYFHLGKADNIKSIAYVENVIEATLFLAKRMKQGVSIYNYADEPQLTSRQIADLIAAALNKKIKITVPKFIGVLLGLPFDLAIKVTGKNLPISTARIRKLGTQTYHSAKKIFNEGYTAKYTTSDGIKKMVEWYLMQR
jgi:GlcNAc-P-P-Und epimerase